ncbi:MAG: DegT/DnrJ/EryC1/StrS family aminotransferase [Thaumarchaeota archaeon]|nr:DegT/DnrJ/EryC1/StrS family aminotransferase [Nitrososphaerota archaeon]
MTVSIPKEEHEENFRFIGNEEKEAVLNVLDHQQLCYYQYDEGLNFVGVGNYVRKFEEGIAGRIGLERAIALNSGTSAVEAALAACGIQPGDEVIVTPKSFIASCIPVVGFNAVPVFSDIDPKTGCLTAKDIEAKITDRTKAILVVHLFGQPAEMDPIMELARKHHLLVIEDCAEAYDAYYKGRRVGTFGDVALFSLQHSKHITTGEGGVVLMNSPEMYSKAFGYSNMGSARGLDAQESGHNFFTFGHNHRMSELSAAVGFSQLSKIGTFNERRRVLVRAIEEELKDTPGIELPYVYPDTIPNYWLYSIVLDRNLHLGASNIIQTCRDEENVTLWSENAFWHQVPCYLEPVFQEMNRTRKTTLGFPLPDYVRYDRGLCPKMEDVAPRSVIFPMHHGVPERVVRSQAKAVRRMVERRTQR